MKFIRSFHLGRCNFLKENISEFCFRRKQVDKNYTYIKQMEVTVVKFKKMLLITSCLTIPLLLSGCGEYSKAYELRKADIVEYNTLVTDTLYAYGKAKVFAESNQQALEDFIFTNKYFQALVDAEVTVPNITEEQIDLFNYRSIIYNDYYTSLGSSTVRQVIVIKGKNNHIMNVKIIWSEDGIIDFKREVREQ